MTDNHDMEENGQFSGEIPAETSSELIAVTPEDDLDEIQTKERKNEYEKRFTLRYFIPLEEYVKFHKITSAQSIQKTRRKTLVIGCVEIVLGIAFLVTQLTSDKPSSMSYYLAIALLIFMGGYQILTGYFLYDKLLNKAISKEYKKYSYFQNEIVVDFYPNKYVQHIQGKEADTYWRSIKELRVSEDLYMIMEESCRCLLIPKAGISDQQEALEELLQEVCTNFEKKRYEV